jgi:hypothetical protein
MSSPGSSLLENNQRSELNCPLTHWMQTATLLFSESHRLAVVYSQGLEGKCIQQGHSARQILQNSHQQSGYVSN